MCYILNKGKKMKKFIGAAAFAAVVVPVKAATEQAKLDTMSVQQISEVVVKAVRAPKNAPFAVANIEKRELQSFSQFGSDLDKDTKQRLAKGERIVEILKQGQNSPVAVENQVIIIYAVINNYLKDIPLEKVGDFERDLYKHMEEAHPDITASIREEKVLTPDNEEKLKAALKDFSEKYV